VFGLAILFAIITLSIIAPFFDTPALKRSGKLIYYSPLFLAEKESNGLIIVHGGTLFDYVFVIDRQLSGRQRTNFIIKSYLEGILNLIEAHEQKKNTVPLIRGTTYFLNERTAGRIGMVKVKTDILQQLIMIFNYVNLLVTNSIAKKRLSFPNVSTIKTYQVALRELIKRKKIIEGLHEKLKLDDFKMN
jgi:hypothetical protein